MQLKDRLIAMKTNRIMDFIFKVESLVHRGEHIYIRINEIGQRNTRVIKTEKNNMNLDVNYLLEN